MDKKIYLVILLLIGLLFILRPEGSTFSNVTEGDGGDTTFIFYAPWCGHCKRSMPEFEKAADSSDSVELVNSDENPDAVSKYGIQGFPTIIKVKSSGEIKKYSGERTADDILAFANNG